MAEPDKNAKLENLLHAINHDLRTPLGNIRSATTILLQDLSTPLSEDQRIFIEIIDRSILRLLDQSNRLILFGQIAFGQAKLEHILLSDLLGNAKNTLKTSYEIDEVIFNNTGNPLIPCYSFALSSLLALLAAGDSKQQSETLAAMPPTIQATTEANLVRFCVTSQMLTHEFAFGFTELANEIVQLHGSTLTNSDENGRKQFTFAIPLMPATE
jgi:light-regulated signal transduction histidine kinase (bacteriophytochrome)